MEKQKEQVNLLLKSAVKAMIKHDSDEWPPGCSLFNYQPVHPRAKVTEKQENQTTNQE